MKDYLEQYNDLDISLFKDQIINKLANDFEPFDDRLINTTTVLSELVDNVIGISEQVIIETIEQCHIHYNKNKASSTVTSDNTFFSNKLKSSGDKFPTQTNKNENKKKQSFGFN